MPDVLTLFWIRHKRFKKIQKNLKPSHCVILCDIVSIKNNKFGILQISLKKFWEMSYHVRSFMAFKANDQCYGHIHGIVFLNEPILCTHVHLGMAHKVVQGSFQLYLTKNTFSIFWVPKRVIFVKHLPRVCFKMMPHHFCKILDHILSTIHQLVAIQSFLATSQQKEKFLTI